MLSKNDSVNRIVECGVMAAARLPNAKMAVDTTLALLKGGVSVIEFSMTMPDALEAIRRVATEVGDKVLLGVGTVLDAETARAAILTGAQFIVSPTINHGVIEIAHRYGKPVIPGALTPNEILLAYEQGAAMVKVFPAGNLGPSYIRAVLAPLGHIPLLADGGVTLENAKEFILAGAVALGVGRHLVDYKAAEAGEYGKLTELARRFVAAVREARSQRALGQNNAAALT
ncbi:MAG: 2-dehydro-3-deoxyphosphogluconate aldolase [Chloroflexi bacterium]|nr:2-dehydro-3-deoxyphosphogluconate aldolase [Chloroflexota bacterium]